MMTEHGLEVFKAGCPVVRDTIIHHFSLLDLNRYAYRQLFPQLNLVQGSLLLRIEQVTRLHSSGQSLELKLDKSKIFFSV